MKLLFASAILLSALAVQAFGQSTSLCERYDDRDKLVSGKNAALYFVEVCKRPNPDDRPALSIVFTSTPGGDDAMRIYSYDAAKPLTPDGVYVERNGAKQFVLHRMEIEWTNGSRTNLDSIDAKKKKKLVAVFDAASELLKSAGDNRRLPSSNSQDRSNVWTVVNFMFDYQLNGKH